MNEYPLLDGIY